MILPLSSIHKNVKYVPTLTHGCMHPRAHACGHTCTHRLCAFSYSQKNIQYIRQ